MSRARKALAMVFVSALLLVVMAAPAFAFHHVFVPASACADENSGGNAGGNNPRAFAALQASGQHTFPLPPFGTPGANQGQGAAHCANAQP